jgi:hypothetical protein
MSKHIGELQDVPLDDDWTLDDKRTSEKYALYVDWNASPEKIASVRLSNKDEAGREIIRHEIRIEGENGRVNKALEDITKALKDLKSMEEKIESEMKEKDERELKKRNLDIPVTPMWRRPTGKEQTLKKPILEYGLVVKRSLYEQSIFIIVKGTEKENTKVIEFVGEGALVSVSRENIKPLVEKLTAILQSPSMRE